MSNHINEDKPVYYGSLNDSRDVTTQPFPSLTETSKLHISVSGPHLSKGFPKEIEGEIERIVSQELVSVKERSAINSHKGFDISLKGLNLSSTVEQSLSDTIGEKLQQLLLAKQIPLDERTTISKPDDVNEIANKKEVGSIEQPLSSTQQGLCICAGNLPGSEYPIINPRLVTGPLPHVYALYFYEDIIRMDVQEDPSLTGCQMWVGLASRVSWTKEIAGWHLCNGQISSVTTSGSDSGPNFMLLQKQDCQSGVHTVFFKKAKLFGIMTGMYTLDMNTFWPFLGGKKVTFTWISDTQGSGKWGHESTISGGRADGTLLKEVSDASIYVIYGGAKFHIPDPTTFERLGFDWTTIQTVADNSVASIADAPRDGTLLRELSGAIYVIYGGAKFHIPDMNQFNALGFDPGNARQLWDGALSLIPTTPYDNTLLKEVNSDAVYVIRGGKKYHISSPTRFYELCFYWENLRVVHDGALAGFPNGGVL